MRGRRRVPPARGRADRLEMKSRRIGQIFPLGSDLQGLVDEETVFGFDRVDGSWREWSGRPAGALAALLDGEASEHAGDEPPTDRDDEPVPPEGAPGGAAPRR